MLQVGDTAYVEAAEAVGLHLVAPEKRDAVASSSYGVGELLLAAAATGVHRVVVGVGGTATTDGGRGLVAAMDGHRDELAGIELVAATATDAPLMGHAGAAHGFAAGKGADREARERSRRPCASGPPRPTAASRSGRAPAPAVASGSACCCWAPSGSTAPSWRSGPSRLDDRVRAADLAVTGGASSTGSRCAAGWSPA